MHLSNCRPMIRQGLVWRWLGERPKDEDDETRMAELRAAWAAYNRGERDPFVVAGAREYSALTRRQARARKAQQQSGIAATSTLSPSAACETIGAQIKTAPAALQRCESGASPTNSEESTVE